MNRAACSSIVAACLLGVTGFLAGAGVAQAQPGGSVAQPAAEPAPPPPPAPVTITPPAVKKDEGAAYPAQAIADKVKDPVTIDLVLSLDANGAVTSVTVENPAGHGFDEAALAAARQLRFAPGRVSGVAVAVRVTWTCRFRASG